MARQKVTTSDLIACAEIVVAALRPGVNLDWSARTGPIVLRRIRTACHIADSCLAYAGQIATGAENNWLPFRVLPWFEATPDGMLDFILGAARMFAATADAYPQATAWHPFGMGDTEGFVAMGCAETLVHGWDLAHGMDLPIEPDRAICRRVLERLAPQADSSDDAWLDLLNLCHRLPVDGRRPRGRWRYHLSPVEG